MTSSGWQHWHFGILLCLSVLGGGWSELPPHRVLWLECWAFPSARPLARARTAGMMFVLGALCEDVSKHSPSCSLLHRAAPARGLIGTPGVQSRGRHSAGGSLAKALVGASVVFTRLIGMWSLWDLGLSVKPEISQQVQKLFGEAMSDRTIARLLFFFLRNQARKAQGT